MFLPAEINIDINPLVQRIPNSPFPTPKGPDSPGPSHLTETRIRVTREVLSTLRIWRDSFPGPSSLPLTLVRNQERMKT